ncbi:MAG: hypothetical protein RIQ89_2107 [Bacteroidota bacterium]
MSFHSELSVTAIDDFKLRTLSLIDAQPVSFFLDSNNSEQSQPRNYSTFDWVTGLGTLQKIEVPLNNLFDLQKFLDREKKFTFITLAYDLKHEIENIEDTLPSYTKWPKVLVYQPQFIISCKNNLINISSQGNAIETEAQIFNQIKHYQLPLFHPLPKIRFEPNETKINYLDKISTIKKHIQAGDVYEINYCTAFNAIADINPLSAFLKINQFSPMPFAAYVKFKDQFVLCASPERFLKKEKSTILTQPIKGTKPRILAGSDTHQVNELAHSLKDQTENVMIVDLCRNDLSRIAKKKSVSVPKLFEIQSFKQVHQMVSTIEAKVDEKICFTDVLRATFPMGSMTGAPKVSAMQLAAKYETQQRNIYSGSIGYITPEGDFDLNVVIRSLVGNKKNNYLSYAAGGAITAASSPIEEYEECLLKAKILDQIF